MEKYFHEFVPQGMSIIFFIKACDLALPEFRVGSVQGCGSGSGLDPDSIGSVDPDPDSESGSGFGIRIRIQEGKNDPQK
jgi:hypothetical protein